MTDRRITEKERRRLLATCRQVFSGYGPCELRRGHKGARLAHGCMAEFKPKLRIAAVTEYGLQREGPPAYEYKLEKPDARGVRKRARDLLRDELDELADTKRRIVALRRAIAGKGTEADIHMVRWDGAERE